MVKLQTKSNNSKGMQKKSNQMGGKSFSKGKKFNKSSPNTKKLKDPSNGVKFKNSAQIRSDFNKSIQNGNKESVVKEKKHKFVRNKPIVKSTEEMDDEDDDNQSNASAGSFDLADAENITDSENENAEDNASEVDMDSDDNEQDTIDIKADDIEDHKKALTRLKDTDPEFYKFLQDNDKKLLQFNLSDSEDELDDGEDDEVHKPATELEIASDESDFEPDEDDGKERDSRIITLKLLKQWQNDIQTDKSNKTILCLVQAFNAALRRVSNAEDHDEPAHYKVDGSSVFNAIIQLCVLELGPAIRRFLGLKPGSKLAPHKCKKFVKVKTLLKGYFTDLFKILGGVTSTNILNVLLKHLHFISPLIVSFSQITKPLLKKLVQLWGSADESVRVVSFLCILRITHNQQQALLDSVLKMMYMTYVRNSKFVSANSLPGINFMRRSLVEMYALDLNVSYQHVFLFIRQLAINLRNAITVNKKENSQAVYNWQFINSLRLWGNLLAVTCNKPQLQPLIYPFVQICLGTVKLIPTTQYFPLRFHIVQILMDLSRDAQVFIPILPFLLEVLTTYDFNKKHQKVSMKPLHFTCLLRLSKSQLNENGFKDTVIETIYGQLLEYMACQSHSIAFPDLSLYCKLQLKEFNKKCNVANYQRKMGQILEKIDQNTQLIEKERKTVGFNLTEFKQISAWETTIKNNGTPLSTFYENWNKLRNVKRFKQATNNEEIGDYNLPALKKCKKVNRKEVETEVTLFPSDSEDDDHIGFGEKKVTKPKRGKRGGKLNRKNVGDEQVGMDVDVEGQDFVEDLKMSDW